MERQVFPTKRTPACARRGRSLVALAVALGLTMVSPKPVHAVTGAEVIAAGKAIKEAYSLYKEIKGLWEPSTADLIQDAVNKLIVYMNTARDQQWVAAARSAAADMKSLSTHQPSDPTNPNLYNNIWLNLSSNGIDPMYTILRTGTDGLSMYQTAPTLNQLATLWIGLLNMKDQIWPGYPPTWRDYQGRLQLVMDLDYYMVGARNMMCYPGYNPGHGSYDWAHAPLGPLMLPMGSNGYNVYKKSQLWNYLAGNYHTSGVSNGYIGLGNPDCSAIPSGTLALCNVRTVGGDSPQKCWYWTKDARGWPVLKYATSQCLPVAMTKFTAVFENDPVRQITNAGMTSLLMLGGGLDGVSDSSTSLPKSGSVVDPWVTETGYCSSYSNKAYPLDDHMCGWLRSGELLKAGEHVSSCDDRFHLYVQSDGPLALYQGVPGPTTLLWGASFVPAANNWAAMQTDGNFVFYNALSSVLFATWTHAYPGSTLAVQNDGNLVVYDNATWRWQSGTCCH